MTYSASHNHITRDIKRAGECPSCDRYHATSLARENIALRNVIFGALETFENDGSERALRYLTVEAQERRIDRYMNEDYT